MLHCANPVKTQGIVLISVLFLLQIISMLGLYFLQASLLLQRVNHTYWQHYTLFNFANTMLRQVELNEHIESERCVIPKTSHLSIQSWEWWETYACHQVTQLESYYYVIEPLSSNDGIKYFRITLLAYSKNKVFRVFLQSVVVKSNDNSRGDVERQSWRVLNE